MYIYTYICIHAYTYIYVSIFIYICIHIHIMYSSSVAWPDSRAYRRTPQPFPMSRMSLRLTNPHLFWYKPSLIASHSRYRSSSLQSTASHHKFCSMKRPLN